MPRSLSPVRSAGQGLPVEKTYSDHCVLRPIWALDYLLDTHNEAHNDYCNDSCHRNCYENRHNSHYIHAALPGTDRGTRRTRVDPRDRSKARPVPIVANNGNQAATSPSSLSKSPSSPPPRPRGTLLGYQRRAGARPGAARREPTPRPMPVTCGQLGRREGSRRSRRHRAPFLGGSSWRFVQLRDVPSKSAYRDRPHLREPKSTADAPHVRIGQRSRCFPPRQPPQPSEAACGS